MLPYKDLIHGGDLASACQQTGRSTFLDFSANISPLGLPDSVKSAIVQGLHQYTAYPDPLCRELRGALSRYESIPEEYILCGNGASDLIFRLAYALRPKRALLLAPTFEEYRLALTQVGCHCVFHPLREEEAFLPRSTLAEEAAACDLVLLCNPNNPTGALLPPDQMRRLLEACICSNTVLVVDECFLDFLPNEEAYTLKKKLAAYDRLILLRAFTKIFAMAGLRLGYALSSGKELLKKMDQAGPAWNVSIPAQLAGIAAAGELDYRQQVRTLIAQERPWLHQTLESLGCRVYPGAANYLFFRCSHTDLAQRLLQQGVLIRDCANYQGLGPGYFRVAVRNRIDNTALVGALKECLQP